jgi:tetratricopeptide (TPR) repeat protein
MKTVLAILCCMVFIISFFLFSPFFLDSSGTVPQVSAGVHEIAGDLLVQSHYPDAALACYQYAAMYDPGNNEVRRSIGVALIKLGRYQEASGVYQDLVAGDPSDFKSWKNLAVVQRMENESAASLESYRHARELKPGDSTVVLGESLVYIDESRYEEAFRTFDQYYPTDHEEAQFLLLKGDLLMSMSEALDQDLKTMYSSLSSGASPSGDMSQKYSQELEYLQEAAECYQQAIAKDPLIYPQVTMRMLARVQKSVTTYDDILLELN